ncbi:MAG: transglycosylase domain-containing protein [Patescibacteria group bacterium]|nr:transglycosylase domain-containing protein [Patescibacteria group bacterium]
MARIKKIKKIRIANLTKNILFLIGILSFSLVSFFILYVSLSSLNLPPIDLVGQKLAGGGTRIYDRTGNVLLYDIGSRRYWVNYNQIPKNVVISILAAEDSGFFYNPGISLKGIVRSAWLDLKTMSFQYGGSTITQQLVRNLFLTDQKTLVRKIEEIILALEFEKKYTKEEILTMYLNAISFGEDNYGVKAAADFYFGKDLKDLSLGEAATLAAIPNAPSYYDPDIPGNYNRLIERRNFILKHLLDLGWINQTQYQTAVSEKIKTIPRRYVRMAAPHFVLEVKSILEKMFPGVDLSTAGLKVITTLDYNDQKIAEAAVQAGVINNEKLYKGDNASLLMMDNRTGEILAMVGSVDFNNNAIDGQVNMTIWPRQPGSAFKPISYVTLFQLGYPIDTIVFDLPTNFGTAQDPYQPKNFDHRYLGPVSLPIALDQSRNVPSVKVFYLAGPDRVIENARKFGLTTIKNYSHYGLSLGLGTAPVRMIDMIRVYGVFADDGNLVSQTLIKKITNAQNDVIYQYKPNLTRVIDSQPVRMLNKILSDIKDKAGLFQSSLNLVQIPGYQIALKTGTTDNYRDAWTFGYTPDFTVAVWAGNTNGQPMEPGGISILAALPIWHDFVSQVIKNFPANTFPQPLPIETTKPMLDGSWLTPSGIHNILYYVNPNDPLGPAPTNPADNPQYLNWEEPVQNWARSLIEKKSGFPGNNF